MDVLVVISVLSCILVQLVTSFQIGGGEFKTCPTVNPQDVDIDQIKGKWHLSLLVFDAAKRNFKDNHLCVIGDVMVINSTSIYQNWDMFSGVTQKEPTASISLRATKEKPGVWNVHTPTGDGMYPYLQAWSLIGLLRCYEITRSVRGRKSTYELSRSLESTFSRIQKAKIKDQGGLGIFHDMEGVILSLSFGNIIMDPGTQAEATSRFEQESTSCLPYSSFLLNMVTHAYKISAKSKAIAQTLVLNGPKKSANILLVAGACELAGFLSVIYFSWVVDEKFNEF